uniref:STIM1/2 EF-hand domain-containing protein n=1 Tax=Hucho hucho TaxID=62062 RepID=A0A4W5K5D5_9TELE
MMLLLSPVLLLLRGVLIEASHGIIQDSGYYHHNDPALGLTFAGQRTVFDSTDPCLVVSPPCMNEADRYSLEALRNIHREMDDDQDGGIEVEESVEFIIEDMKQQQTNKHSNLHREDQHITIEELWRGWKFSEGTLCVCDYAMCYSIHSFFITKPSHLSPSCSLSFPLPLSLSPSDLPLSPFLPPPLSIPIRPPPLSLPTPSSLYPHPTSPSLPFSP